MTYMGTAEKPCVWTGDRILPEGGTSASGCPSKKIKILFQMSRKYMPFKVRQILNQKLLRTNLFFFVLTMLKIFVELFCMDKVIYTLRTLKASTYELKQLQSKNIT